LTTSPPTESNSSGKSKFADPIPWIMMLTAIVLDQLTKWLTIQNLAVGQSWPETGFFRFTHAWNTGTAFSLFQGQGDILTWVSLGAVVILTWIYRSIDNPSWLLRIAFGMQFGGAIGNIIDRVRIGHVTDFIDVGPWPIFNIADSSIVIGIGLMIFYFWFLDKAPEKTGADPKTAEESVAESSAVVEASAPSVSAESSEPAVAKTSLESNE
jgi:signal peptidase II